MTNLRLRYQTLEFENTDIHLCTLRDRQQFSDPYGDAEKLGISSALWPLFGIVWPSSIVLADHMLHFNIKKKRILEIGCGIGVSSILLNKRDADITATDHHPAVIEFLERNRKLNGLSTIDFFRADWANEEGGFGKFDLIIGSDVLYDEFSLKSLAGFIQRHAKEQSEVILVDPKRGNKNKFEKELVRFGFKCDQQVIRKSVNEAINFNGHILTFLRE